MDEPPTPHTYHQAADALGIEAEAVRARLRRGALRRGPLTNDRRPTVMLSPAEIATIRAGVRTQHPDSTPETGPDSAGRPDERDRIISALEAEAATLREVVGRERERADKAEGESAILREQVEAERERAGRAEAEREAARAEREAAKVAAALAEGEAKGLRLALEEARRPFWRRWLG
jgi:hypothetical protein